MYQLKRLALQHFNNKNNNFKLSVIQYANLYKRKSENK